MVELEHLFSKLSPSSFHDLSLRAPLASPAANGWPKQL